MAAVLPWHTNADADIAPGHGLGWRIETLRSYPRLASTVYMPLRSFSVNRRLDLPYQYIPKYDQGEEGACVGYGWSWAMSILNRRFYAARKLYLEAQFVDSWDDTPPQEGTSVYAGAQVLQKQGHWRFARGITFAAALFEGISSFHSAATVDEVRNAIAMGVPVVLGINWYSNFDSPVWGDFGTGGNRWWIGRGELGNVRGGHCICCFGARDDIQAVTLVNSWGANYPVVNLPYNTLAKLLTDGAEAIIPTDR